MAELAAAEADVEALEACVVAVVAAVVAVPIEEVTAAAAPTTVLIDAMLEDTVFTLAMLLATVTILPAPELDTPEPASVTLPKS